MMTPIIKQIGFYDNKNIISIKTNLGLSLSIIFDNFLDVSVLKILLQW